MESEIDERVRDLDTRLRAQGLDLERYMGVTGQEPEAIREEFREASELAVRVDLGLRAVAYVEYLDDNDDQIDAYLDEMAVQTGLDVEEIRVRLTNSGRMLDVRADVLKRAALEWLIDSADVVDEFGHSLDRVLLEPPEPVIPEHGVTVDETSTGDTDTNGGTGDDRKLTGDEEENA